MERTTAVASEYFFVNRNRQRESYFQNVSLPHNGEIFDTHNRRISRIVRLRRIAHRKDRPKWGVLNLYREIMDNNEAVTFFNILKDCLMMSVVIMVGTALTLLLG